MFILLSIHRNYVYDIFIYVDYNIIRIEVVSVARSDDAYMLLWCIEHSIYIAYYYIDRNIILCV